MNDVRNVFYHYRLASRIASVHPAGAEAGFQDAVTRVMRASNSVIQECGIGEYARVQLGCSWASSPSTSLPTDVNADVHCRCLCVFFAADNPALRLLFSDVARGVSAVFVGLMQECPGKT